MQLNLAQRLWGEKASLKWLLLLAAILLLGMLGARELWTQEWRWGDITVEMLYRHDYFHPYLASHAYYDKPLLSYWLMIICAKLLGGLSELALRLPSALAGILAIWCTYWLGNHLVNRRVGILAGWLLLTTYYFIFWARTANADMLNLAGTLLALVWYFSKKQQPRFVNYAVFFLILAITSLCKGLIGAIVPALMVMVDLTLSRSWRQHITVKLFLAFIPALLVYLTPFALSTYFSEQGYTQSGLMQVFRENILRFVEPFDHKGPWYTYLVFLPVYLIPWTIFFIPALISLPKRWRDTAQGQRCLYWTLLVIFLFFSLSGSRRNYYTLPMVPFAILMIAEWIEAQAYTLAKRKIWAARIIVIAYGIFFTLFAILQPIYYQSGGMRDFAKQVKTKAQIVRPWGQWQVTLLDARSKVAFYLNPAQPAIFMGIPATEREQMTSATLLQRWPFIRAPKTNVIIVTRQQFAPYLSPYLKSYTVVTMRPYLGQRYTKDQALDAPVAFIPPLMEKI